jgi:hypothetical protein
MKDIDIDISEQTSKSLNQFSSKDYDAENEFIRTKLGFKTLV